jgi:hypothetical protein
MCDDLARADDDRLLAADRGDDLLAEERTASALDHVEARVDLVRAIDRQVDRVDVLERREGDPERARLLFRIERRRHAADGESLLADPLGEPDDREVHRRACPEPHAHPVPDELGRPPPRDFLRVLHGSGQILVTLDGGREPFSASRGASRPNSALDPGIPSSGYT